MAKQVRIKTPTLAFSFNKHHTVELYVLAAGEFIQILNAKAEVKRIGPSIVEVTQKGINRTLKSHPINGKEIWERIRTYVQAGIWALSSREVAGRLPAELVPKSLRFHGTSLEHRKAISKRATARPDRQ